MKEDWKAAGKVEAAAGGWRRRVDRALLSTQLFVEKLAPNRSSPIAGELEEALSGHAVAQPMEVSQIASRDPETSHKKLFLFIYFWLCRSSTCLFSSHRDEESAYLYLLNSNIVFLIQNRK